MEKEAVNVRVKSPCLNCELREVGCHSTCEEYIIYSQKNEDWKKEYAKTLNIPYRAYIRERKTKNERLKKQKGYKLKR